MHDSYSSSKLANEPTPCSSCGRINCICDEETMQAMDDEDRLMEEIERQEESDRLDG